MVSGAGVSGAGVMGARCRSAGLILPDAGHWEHPEICDNQP